MKKLTKISLFSSLLLTSSLSFGQAATEETGTIEKILSFWPFVVILVLLLLAVLWYQSIKTMRRRRKSGRKAAAGLNPVTTLGFVTVFLVVLLALPWFLNNMEDKAPTATKTTEIAPENRVETVFLIEGMTCTGCENAIINRVAELDGVQTVNADWQAAQTQVVYDQTKVTEDLIVGAIMAAGYTVTGILEE
ncbi:MAG: cation transporter [Bacteroides sp.]|jgi:copper chaperone CopZ|nr:cation transporter [Bacteroides sp.]